MPSSEKHGGTAELSSSASLRSIGNFSTADIGMSPLRYGRDETMKFPERMIACPGRDHEKHWATDGLYTTTL